jgi:2-oxoglutarate ferredoxin oxidoreductase subunit gamma
MQTEIILSGFGGQGIMFAGQLVAYTAMDAGLEVTWIPSYGPEMRGGTANCTVIISDEQIGSPSVRNPKAALVFNLPSYEKYISLVSPGGVFVANSSMIDREPQRNDVEEVFIPANDIAESIGNIRLANMIMIGSLIKKLPVLTIEQLDQGLNDHIPEKHRNLIELNCRALREGFTYTESERVMSG